MQDAEDPRRPRLHNPRPTQHIGRTGPTLAVCKAVRRGAACPENERRDAILQGIVKIDMGAV